ncbi:MAG: N-6 DNA methylase, partial [candidate division WOR-3 bacterium]
AASRDNEKWVQQTINYLKEIPRRERHKPERLAGVIWDGKKFIFIMPSEAGWRVEEPVDVNEHTCERFLSLLVALSTEKAVQPEYLIRDFGENSYVARKVVRTLYQTLKKTDVPFVKVMFSQWSNQFSEVCNYDQASKLDLSREAERFGIRESGIEPFRFFFCLHTYYASFIKLLAFQIVNFYLMPKLGTDLRQAIAGDNDRLKEFLARLERGGIYRDFGIANFLEGDFFKWYLEAWDDEVAGAMREIIRALADYSLATLDADPNVTRDILKALYQGLVPKRLRHNLGEYYTPDWLAERLINMTVRGELKPEDRILDPACGSGTFLVIAIRKIREYARRRMLPEAEVLNKILLNVVGFDLNPLAVITARTNYLLALGDLLQHRKDAITIPVYLCDSVVTPHEKPDIFGHARLQINTTVGRFTVPKKIIRRDLIRRMAEVLEELVEIEADHTTVVNRLATELQLDKTQDSEELRLLSELYDDLLKLKRNRINGVWARVIKNAFAPLFLKNFDYIVGNPPWINWENLPEHYRDEEVIPLFQHTYNLFPHRGFRARHGSSKMDISALMTYVVADQNLKRGGRLGFLITQSVFKTDAGKGFRKFQLPDGTPLGVIHVDDLTHFQPFEGATNRTAVLVLEKGKKTQYGRFTYWMWLKRRGKPGSLPQDADWKDIQERVDFNQFTAVPVDKNDPTSQWLTGRPLAVKAVSKVLGKSDYVAHAGAYTCGANAVYWVRIVAERPDGLVVVANITEGAKRQVESITAPLEKDLLYPLLRGRDVRRWQANPSAFIIVPQSEDDRKHGIRLDLMKAKYPKSFLYFEKFKKILEARPAYVKYLQDEPYYSLYDIKDYTFAPWKVVWREQAKCLTASVAGLKFKKPVIPDHKLMVIDSANENEAHYICANLNSSPARYATGCYAISISHDTHILQNICIPRFDPSDEVHLRLAELSERAHEVAGGDDEDRESRLAEIETEIDQLAAHLWGLTERELKDIKLALEELG